MWMGKKVMNTHFKLKPHLKKTKLTKMIIKMYLEVLILLNSHTCQSYTSVHVHGSSLVMHCCLGFVEGED